MVARQAAGARDSDASPSEPWRVAWGDQWRAVLALGDADVETMTMIVLAITRWAYREGYRAGVRSGTRRRRRT